MKRYTAGVQRYSAAHQSLDQQVPLVDLIAGDLPDVLQTLGWLGLGEAFIYLTPYRDLSEGQKIRAQIALTLATRPPLIVIDEFLSNLDRFTAKSVAYKTKTGERVEIYMLDRTVEKLLAGAEETCSREWVRCSG